MVYILSTLEVPWGVGLGISCTSTGLTEWADYCPFIICMPRWRYVRGEEQPSLHFSKWISLGSQWALTVLRCCGLSLRYVSVWHLAELVTVTGPYQAWTRQCSFDLPTSSVSLTTPKITADWQSYRWQMTPMVYARASENTKAFNVLWHWEFSAWVSISKMGPHRIRFGCRRIYSLSLKRVRVCSCYHRIWLRAGPRLSMPRSIWRWNYFRALSWSIWLSHSCSPMTSTSARFGTPLCIDGKRDRLKRMK